MCDIQAVEYIFNGPDLILALCRSELSIIKIKSDLLIAKINGSDAYTTAAHQHPAHFTLLTDHPTDKLKVKKEFTFISQRENIQKDKIFAEYEYIMSISGQLTVPLHDQSLAPIAVGE